ncbi:rhodanese-like domain-containing protein [Aquitalea sp. USM4]|uniref:rhodanese-like domain-containing protein n=1 Tax=Aquitalea sp. USM4 TaxID=1590041 RepID=UPI0013F17AB3|nr:rhodanese-like domain-containing protein [Aquitalea sp. USM4]
MFEFIFRLFGSPSQPVVLPPNALIVDVREAGEFASGHVQDAVNIPLSALPAQTERLRKLGQPVVVYCRSGARSAMARKVLLNGGVSEVINGKNTATVNRMLGR